MSFALTPLPQFANGLSAANGQAIAFGIGAHLGQPATFDAVHSTELFTIPSGNSTLAQCVDLCRD